MPCHAARLSLLSPQCLWISDEILIDAFNRFARVSLAHKSHPASRRYGSNVPGPLEAHRRHTKRRMGIAAVSAAAPSPAADFAALFGFGGVQDVDFEQDWRWEAPGMKKRRVAWHCGKRPQEDWERFLHVPEVDPIVESKNRFEELCASKSHRGYIQKHDLVDLIDFLQSAADEPDANNTLALVEWLSSKNVSREAIALLLQLFLEKVQLRTLGIDETSSIFVSLMTYKSVDFHLPVIASILRALDENRQPVSVNVVKSTLPYGNLLDQPVLPTRTDCWLRCLTSSIQEFGKDDEGGQLAMRSVYDYLASRVQPNAMAKHFSDLKNVDICRVILRHWVPQMWERLPPRAKILRKHKSIKRFTLDHEAAIDEFEYLLRDDSSAFTCLEPLFLVLRPSGLKFSAAIADQVLEIIKTKGRPLNVLIAFQRIQAVNPAYISIPSARSLISWFNGKDYTRYAIEVVRCVPKLPVRHCHDLILRIASSPHYLVKSYWAWDILLRQTSEDTVPLTERQISRNSLRPEHVDVVHLTAFAFACSNHITARVASRRVWECFRFLAARRAPINNMLTRALVMSTIIRPLKEERRLSTEKFRYVISLVARYEGEEIARKLDTAVFKLWNETIRPRILARERRENALAAEVRWPVQWDLKPPQADSVVHRGSAEGEERAGSFCSTEKDEQLNRRHDEIDVDAEEADRTAMELEKTFFSVGQDRYYAKQRLRESGKKNIWTRQRRKNPIHRDMVARDDPDFVARVRRASHNVPFP